MSWPFWNAPKQMAFCSNRDSFISERAGIRSTRGSPRLISRISKWVAKRAGSSGLSATGWTISSRLTSASRWSAERHITDHLGAHGLPDGVQEHLRPLRVAARGVDGAHRRPVAPLVDPPRLVDHQCPGPELANSLEHRPGRRDV